MLQSNLTTKIESFFSQFAQHIYKKGEILIQPDKNPVGAYYIKDGYVREYGISPSGIEISLHIFVPHTYFPMMWVISDIQNRYYYEALSDVECYSAPKDEILKFLKKNPEILMNLTQRVFLGLDKLTSRLESLSFGKAYEKVISMILYLSGHFGEEKNNKIIITTKFTHRDIASLAGISRETTSREWEKLEKKGLIQYDNQFIVIEDINKLKNELTKE
jgi:CRP/FNR family transcriptional regulator